MADEIILVHRGQVVLDGSLEEIRDSAGKNTVHLDYEGDGSFLESLPNVVQSRVDTNEAEVTLADGADPHAVLEACVGRLRIRRFEVASPSLEEIFIDTVGAEALEGSA